MSTKAQIAHDPYGMLPPERAEIGELSRAARRAVLSPADVGGWPVAWRHAVAARICTLHGQDGLAADYAAGAGEYAPLADPENHADDDRMRTVLAFVDQVATQPSDIAAGDIAGLGDVDVSGADIVRLCELGAYLAYECRVAAGLSLMKGAR